jgi:hypothetical protein
VEHTLSKKLGLNSKQEKELDLFPRIRPSTLSPPRHGSLLRPTNASCGLAPPSRAAWPPRPLAHARERFCIRCRCLVGSARTPTPLIPASPAPFSLPRRQHSLSPHLALIHTGTAVPAPRSRPDCPSTLLFVHRGEPLLPPFHPPLFLPFLLSRSPAMARRGRRGAAGSTNAPTWHAVPSAAHLTRGRWPVSVLARRMASAPERRGLNKLARAPSLLPSCAAGGLARTRLARPWWLGLRGQPARHRDTQPARLATSPVCRVRVLESLGMAGHLCL